MEGRFRKADYASFGLPFSYSWGKKLIKIATSPRILDPDNRPLLPNKADALHQVSLLTDRLFAQGVGEGVIHNQCLVVDIRQFRQSFTEPGETRRRQITVVFECTPKEDADALERLDAFVDAVGKLAEAQFPDIAVRKPQRMRELQF
jgi:hypothetical protein